MSGNPEKSLTRKPLDQQVTVITGPSSGIYTPVAENAGNHVGGKARIPPLLYDPVVVANAILDAVRRAMRGVIPDGAGR